MGFVAVVGNLPVRRDGPEVVQLRAGLDGEAEEIAAVRVLVVLDLDRAVVRVVADDPDARAGVGVR